MLSYAQYRADTSTYIHILHVPSALGCIGVCPPRQLCSALLNARTQTRRIYASLTQLHLLCPVPAPSAKEGVLEERSSCSRLVMPCGRDCAVRSYQASVMLCKLLPCIDAPLRSVLLPCNGCPLPYSAKLLLGAWGWCTTKPSGSTQNWKPAVWMTFSCCTLFCAHANLSHVASLPPDNANQPHADSSNNGHAHHTVSSVADIEQRELRPCNDTIGLVTALKLDSVWRCCGQPPLVACRALCRRKIPLQKLRKQTGSVEFPGQRLGACSTAGMPENIGMLCASVCILPLRSTHMSRAADDCSRERAGVGNESAADPWPEGERTGSGRKSCAGF